MIIKIQKSISRQLLQILVVIVCRFVRGCVLMLALALTTITLPIVAAQSADEMAYDLIQAIREGNTEKVSVLLSQGANVESDYTSETAISFAVQAGHLEIVTLLLEGGAKANDYDLVSAAMHGQINIVKALLAAGTNVNARDDELGATALFYAARMGYVDVVTALINRGADVNAQNGSQGYTALQEASHEGHLEVVTSLMDGGADVNAKGNDSGIQAIYLAASEGHLDVVIALLKRGADANSASDGGVTALARTASAGHLDVVALLLAQGAKVNLGSSALAGAADAGNLEIVKLLLEQDADVNARDFQGNTALMYAARQGNIEIVKTLLEHGADVSAMDTYSSSTPLILAASAGHQDVVMALLDSGADINVRDNEDHSALHEALRREHTDVASTLSERGAENDSIFQRLLDIDLENFIMPLFIVVSLMVVGGFLYTRKRLVQRIRTSGDANLIRDRVLIVVTHILAWLFSTAMYVSIAEYIPSMWGSYSLGEWLIVILFGTITLFVLFVASLVNSLSSQAFVASHRISRWIVFVVFLLVGFAIAMYLTSDALRGFAVIGRG